MQLLHWLSWVGYQLDLRTSSHSTEGNPRVLDQEVLAFPKVGSSGHHSHFKNYAALIPSKKAELEVAEVPFPTCGEDELIIRNHVVAVNPVDWKIQSYAGFNLTYPTILGEDVAGEVLEVGKNLKHKFHAGDRVIAHAMGLEKGAEYGGFQLYPVVIAVTTALIPDDISYIDAAVLPLSISTAAAGLFMNATLGLNYPRNRHLSFASTAEDNPALLLWGGSSSVGSSVIQLASAAGYSVITTASPSNFKFCKDLGAADVLDYHDPDIVRKLINLLKERKLVGSYDAIGSYETVHQNAAVLLASGGGKIASVGMAPDDLPSGVTITRISSGNIVTQEPEVSEEIWGRYVPAALKSGELVPSPKPLVVGRSLWSIQTGLDVQKQGVSAQKVEIVIG
jgi:NADPH:quinone reductase-like Zn-dependent oxidoreductase